VLPFVEECWLSRRARRWVLQWWTVVLREQLVLLFVEECWLV
jgi:hypothetical protein